MRRLIVGAWIGLAALAPQQDDRERLLSAARQVIEAAGNCALLTVAADGSVQARTMDPFPPEDDFVVWMATNRATRKVAELRGDPRASLYYFDPEGVGYVTLIGNASVVERPDAVERYWKPEWEPFYDDANRGDDYILIRFVPTRAEIVSVAHGVASDPRSWMPAVVLFGDPR